MGCGVVEFASRDVAFKVIETFNDTQLGGRQIKCREDRDPTDNKDTDADGTENTTKQNPRPKKEKVPEEERELDPNKVFVANIPWESTELDLTNLFSTIGKVASAQVLATKKGRAMGSGIVEFVNAESSAAAIAQLSGKEWSGRVMTVRPCYK